MAKEEVAPPEYVPCERHFRSEGVCRTSATATHPLQPKSRPSSVDVTQAGKAAAADPLSVVSDPLMTPVDPLSNPLTASKNSDFVPEWTYASANKQMFEEWDEKKAYILNHYTTTATIAVYQENQATIEERDEPKRVDHLKSRLEQLEDPNKAADQEVQHMNQQELLTHVENLRQEMIKAWDSMDRVKTLKLAIQCAKMLGDTSVPQFYPSMFVRVTDVLDTFGNLVYDRIKSKAFIGQHAGKVGDDFTGDMVSSEARETCRNWFYKTASIRELLPRIYVELSLIRCYAYMPHKGRPDFSSLIKRICSTCMGIGSPLVGLYARTYLARKGREVASDAKDYLTMNYYDYLQIFRKTENPEFREKVRMPFTEYMHLFEPGFDWLLKCIADGCPQEVMSEVVRRYRKTSKNALILNQIIKSFKAEQITKKANTMIGLISSADYVSCPQFRMYANFGKRLCECPPPQDQQLQVMNELWKVVSKLDATDQYLVVADVFVEYLVKLTTTKEVNVLLKDVRKHIPKHNDEAVAVLPLLENIVKKVVRNCADFDSIFSMDHFLPLLDLFRRDRRSDAFKTMLESFIRPQIPPTTDAVAIHSLLDAARQMHDGLDYFSSDDERNETAKIICSFIRKIDFGDDFEASLNFLVECRHAFINLDLVVEQLVHSVLKLAMTTRKYVKGKHTKRTHAFVKACMAYCHVTIPSMKAVMQRMWLFNLATQVCLMNQLMGQADAFVKAGLTLVLDVEHKEEDALVLCLGSYIGYLQLMPGHPEHGAFYLVHGLQAVVTERDWAPKSDAKARVLLRMLGLLCAMYQPKFQYQIPKIDSNDTLFGSTPEYRQELLELIGTVSNQLFEDLSILGEADDVSAKKKQATMALHFFNHVCFMMQLNPVTVKLASNLLKLVQKNNFSPPYLKNTLEALRIRADSRPDYRGLVNRLGI